MGLGNTQSNRILLGIAGGKITHKANKDAEPETFSFVEGTLKAIVRRTANVKDIPTEFLDIILEDAGQDYALSVQTAGGVARNIILSLASIESFVGNRIRINPYLSKDGQHTNIAVYNHGQKISWVTANIPPVEEKQFGSKTVKDDSKRLAFVNSYIEAVTAKVNAAAATPQAQAMASEEDIDDGANDEGGWMSDGGQHL